MADKSKNEQYDIVAQAQDVLDLYIKRCFDLNHYAKVRTLKRRTRISMSAFLIPILLAFAALTAALIYFL